MSDNHFGPRLPGVFDFTILFEQSILSLLPTALFILVAPIRINTLISRPNTVVSGSLLWLKLATISFYFSLQATLLALWALPSAPSNRTSLAEAILGVVEALVIAAISYTEHCKSIRPSALLNGYLFLAIILDAALARTFWIRGDMPAIAGVFTVLLAVKVLLLILEELPKTRFAKEKNNVPRETVAGVINRSVFWWLNDLFNRGARLLIGIDDLGNIASKFDSQQEGSHALLKCTFWTFRWQFLAGIFPRLLFSGFTLAQPFLITSVVSHVARPREEDSGRITGGLIGATALVYVGMAVSQAWYKHMTYQLLTMFRGALASMVFKKTLHLQSSTIKDSAPVTLMGTDIETLVFAGDSLHDVWASILELPVSMYLLYRQVGIPSLFILIPTMLTTVYGGLISPAMGPAQALWNGAVQQRLGTTSTMLSQMKGIKMVGLERYFHGLVQGLRNKELDLSLKYRLLLVQFTSLASISEDLTPVVIILAAIFWSRADQGLTVAEAFTSLSLISIASRPLLHILVSMMTLFGALGSFSRLQAFLKLEERHDSRKSIAEASGIRGEGGPDTGLHHQNATTAITLESLTNPTETTEVPQTVVLSNATFTAGDDVEVLQDITLTVPRGSLSMIVGRVGSGKSSILKAIAGELVQKRGSAIVDGVALAYCDQVPWLQNISIRHNIIGQSVLDEKWLSTVTAACALSEDIAIFPEGDLTLVGSGGVTLSGGQKQRVALARAVYSRQPLVLLDDVFSGLDNTTARQVFQSLLTPQGLLRQSKSTIILATNNANYLPVADHITMVEDGRLVHNQISYDSVEPHVWGVLESSITGSSASAEKADDKGPGDVFKAQEATLTAPLPLGQSEAELARQTGDVECYKLYLRSWSTVTLVVVLGLGAIQVVVSKMPQIWLRIWTENGTASRDLVYMGVFVTFAVTSVILAIVDTAYFVVVGIPQSSRYLHNMLLTSVMRAPLSFFSSTDLGITLNRFSQDMTLMDQELPMSFFGAMTLLLRALVETGIIASGASYVAAAIPACLIALYLIQKFYLRTSRQMRFLDIESKSPLYTQFTEALAGLTTIRASGWTPDFMAENHKRLNTSQKPFYLTFCLQRWLQIVLDLLIAGMAVLLVAFALTFTGTTSSAAIGLAMVNLIGFNQTLAYVIVLWTELETSLGAIARLKWFAKNTPHEAKEMETATPPSDWPSNGVIEFKNVSASYSDMSSPVLHNVSFQIQPGQKVGVCGRSGSGKSSLILSILRLLELRSGSICIDGLDLSTMPRPEIRTRLTTLPQDPIKLTGSVRYNLDPGNTIQTDDMLVAVLAKVGMWSVIEPRGGLDADFEDLGFSAGQLQLFCLARALLLRNSVVLLDEATSNVDRQTDEQIRRVIREELGGRTILEVAHRLDAIKDYDVVVVMGEGRILEMGSPKDLLGRPNSAFRALSNSRSL
ncbi:hypothetical protein S7711_08779 [Stachybotrys chartarum IBT 7711]|uniref:Uncharacterized protein n=1 Tax=Stachybotrys chartarum (strain CBS 109288 / IBT 7711) TaxID=1280523 RepID=A0A084AIW2_STACB|nr:hypothetical protein S7711_08779 [Stachybotrys chartarum IBT 7711]